MKGQKSSRQENSPDMKLKEAMVNWLVAATNFYRFYNRISLCLDLPPPHTHSHKTKWIGQCPVSELTAIQVSMHNELGRLLRDLNQKDQKFIANNYEKLTAHTRHLENLNQQANTLLELALLSAC